MQIDPLERRQLLAAITVGRSFYGDMSITGDADSNTIRVTPLSSTQWRIEHSGSINGVQPKPGQTTAVLEVRRPWRALIIDTGDGDDRIELANLGSTIRLKADTGAGDDQIYLRRYAPPTADIVGGRGNDLVDVRDSSGVPTFDIDGGSGNDLIGLRGLSTRRMTVLGNAGDDQVFISGSRTRGGFEYAGGSGNDKIGVHLSELHTPRFVDDAGSAGISVNGCRLFGASYFEGSGDADALTLVDSRNFGDIRIRLGDGDDRYAEHNLAQASITSTIEIDLGDGDNVTEHSMP